MGTKDKVGKIDKAQNLIVELLKQLNIDAKFEVTEEDNLIKIKITGQNLGILIGHRGEALESLQLLVSIILNKQIGEEIWTPVLVDVDNWREQQEDSLRAFLSREINKINESKESIELAPMPPAQRRAAHLIVGEFEGFESESVGEEPNRHLVIKRIKKE